MELFSNDNQFQTIRYNRKPMSEWLVSNLVFNAQGISTVEISDAPAGKGFANRQLN